MPDIKPFWLVSADLKALEVGGGSVASLIMATQNTIDQALAPVRDTATKAAEINQRLKTWYSEQIDNATAPVQQLTDAAAGFIEDVWSTGAHAYLPLPEFGGFTYLRRSLSQALSSGDPNAPTFSDQMEVGGVLLMVSGGQLQVFLMAATIALLMGGNPQVIGAELVKLLTESSGLGELNQDLGNLARMPQAAWNDAQKGMAEWWKKSPISKMADPASFPASIFSDLSAGPAAYDPAFGFVDQDLTLKIKGTGFNGRTVVMLQPASGQGILYTASQFTIKGGKELVIEIPKGFSGGTKSYTVKVGKMIKGQPGDFKDLGPLEIRPGGIMDTLKNAAGELMGTSVFGSWKSIGVGTALNALVPGAAAIAQSAVNMLDNAGAAVDSAGDAVKGGLNATGSAVVNGLDAVADVTDKVGGMAAGFLDELTKLAVGVMIIPPAKGGVHQLNWALNQGLSEYALNAPMVDEDMAVAGIFLCAGAPSGDQVKATLKNVGTVFGIKELEAL